MSGVKTVNVTAKDAGLRLDKWFKEHYPGLTFGRLQKLLRTGQIRVDGARAKTAQRLDEGQAIRVPPLDNETAAKPVGKPNKAAPKVSDRDAEDLRARVLHRDADVLVINKPPGLAVQGGTGTGKNLDAMLDALRFDAKERPRLVHRLDRDTSGVLVLARNREAARFLTGAFKSKEARKLYWAIVVGVPKLKAGRIDLALSKLPGRLGEKVGPDEEDGKRAVTLYRVVDSAGKRAAWLAMEPLTGRTHQLRAHCMVLETPILCDGKYGGQEAFLEGERISRKLHLHARALQIPLPKGEVLNVTAPLPEHMQETWEFFDFDPKNPDAGFSEI